MNWLPNRQKRTSQSRKLNMYNAASEDSNFQGQLISCSWLRQKNKFIEFRDVILNSNEEMENERGDRFSCELRPLLTLLQVSVTTTQTNKM
jgi:hypothetical protein